MDKYISLGVVFNPGIRIMQSFFRFQVPFTDILPLAYYLQIFKFSFSQIIFKQEKYKSEINPFKFPDVSASDVGPADFIVQSLLLVDRGK